ncbi:unnamed protein product [Amaranthus hypochondriacus]
MTRYINWGLWTIFPLLRISILLVLSCQCWHHSTAQVQQNRPATPDPDALKPVWPGPWIFPVPKPEPKKEHVKGAPCNCNCKCDCPKAECNSHSKAGPVVCMPIKCEGEKRCNFAGSGTNLHIPSFFVAGSNQMGHSKYPHSTYVEEHSTMPKS